MIRIAPPEPPHPAVSPRGEGVKRCASLNSQHDRFRDVSYASQGEGVSMQPTKIRAPIGSDHAFFATGTGTPAILIRNEPRLARVQK